MVWMIVSGALLCLTIKGCCGKCVSVYAHHTGDNFFFNFLRMAFCVLIGALTVLVQHGNIKISGGMLAVCVLAGVSNAAFLVGWMLSVQSNAMVTVDVTLTIGSFLPALLCLIFFQEKLLPTKLFGFALIVVASAVLSKGQKRGVSRKGILSLLLAALGDGMTSFSQQLFVRFYMQEGSDGYSLAVYQFYTYVFAALVLGVLWLATLHRYPTPKKGQYRRALPHIVVMAICLFAAAYLQTLATGAYGMSSQMLYPIIRGGCLLTVNITAMLFFGERPTVRSILGSLIALGGMLCISLL